MTKEDLVEEVENILMLPRVGRRGKGHKIVTAVFQTITKELRKGGKVIIPHLGIFEIRERKPHCVIAALGFGPTLKGHYRAPITVPGKKYVYFKRARSLKRASYVDL